MICYIDYMGYLMDFYSFNIEHTRGRVYYLAGLYSMYTMLYLINQKLDSTPNLFGNSFEE